SLFCFYFFFSSRRRHTRSKRDWSSDVCSSDLGKKFPFVCLQFRGQNHILADRIVLYWSHKHKEAENMIRKIIHIDEEKCNGCGEIGRASCRERVEVEGGHETVEENK